MHLGMHMLQRKPAWCGFLQAHAPRPGAGMHAVRTHAEKTEKHDRRCAMLVRAAHTETEPQPLLFALPEEYCSSPQSGAQEQGGTGFFNCQKQPQSSREAEPDLHSLHLTSYCIRNTSAGRSNCTSLLAAHPLRNCQAPPQLPGCTHICIHTVLRGIV